MGEFRTAASESDATAYNRALFAYMNAHPVSLSPEASRRWHSSSALFYDDGERPFDGSVIHNGTDLKENFPRLVGGKVVYAALRPSRET